MVKGNKLSALVDRNGLLLACTVAPANIHDFRLYESTLEAFEIPEVHDRPAIISADAAYDAREIRQYNRRSRRCSKRGRSCWFDPEIYKKRNAIERFFYWTETLKKIVPRYERYEHSFIGLIHLVCSIIIERVLGWPHTKSLNKSINEGVIMPDNLNVLYPDSLYPKTSGGSLRTLNMARLAQSTFHSVCVYCTDADTMYKGDLNGVHVCQSYKYRDRIDKYSYYTWGLFSRNFSLRPPECAFDDINSAAFQLEGPYFYNLLKKKGIKDYILNEHNVYWELLDFPAYSPKERLYHLLAAKRDKNIEIEALCNATQILVCSEQDKMVLSENIQNIEDKIIIIPNCVDFIQYKIYLKQHSSQINESGKKTILFTGGLSYPPNVDAVYTICNDIAPNFENNVEFIIAGDNPPTVKKPENVIFLGYVKDIMQTMLQSDICIAPLRYGSGTRFKILEYMAMSKPVVSTYKGAEGIEYTNHRDIIIEDDFTEFSGRIADLLENRAVGEWLSKNAQELVCQKYDWEIYRKPLHDAYEACF